jgi:hypothetical protein
MIKIDDENHSVSDLISLPRNMAAGLILLPSDPGDLEALLFEGQTKRIITDEYYIKG